MCVCLSISFFVAINSTHYPALSKHVHLFQCISMCDYDVTDLVKEDIILVVTSTYGNGDPPDNGKVNKHLIPIIVKVY